MPSSDLRQKMTIPIAIEGQSEDELKQEDVKGEEDGCEAQSVKTLRQDRREAPGTLTDRLELHESKRNCYGEVQNGQSDDGDPNCSREYEPVAMQTRGNGFWRPR